MSTYAPDDLLAIRRYLISVGLDPAGIGIVGDASHAATGGYHEGRADLLSRLDYDYSIVQSPRDRYFLTDAASALDIPNFSRLQNMSISLVDACKRGDPQTGDIREVIYSPDGVTVKRWDRLGRSSTGDSSHLWHTHISFFRDSQGRRHNTTNILGWFQWYFEGGSKVSTSNIVDAADTVTAVLTGTTKAGYANDGQSAEHSLAAVENRLTKLLEQIGTAVTSTPAPDPNVVKDAVKEWLTENIHIGGSTA